VGIHHLPIRRKEQQERSRVQTCDLFGSRQSALDCGKFRFALYAADYNKGSTVPDRTGQRNMPSDDEIRSLISNSSLSDWFKLDLTLFDGVIEQRLGYFRIRLR
jgi:hypothetical protein